MGKKKKNAYPAAGPVSQKESPADTAAAHSETADAKISVPAESEAASAIPIAKVRSILCAAGLPELLFVRLIAVFFLVSGINAVRRRAEALYAFSNWQDYVTHTSFGGTVLLYVAVFLILTFGYMFLRRKFRLLDHITASASLMFFDLTILWRTNDFYLGAGVIITTLIFLGFILGKMNIQQISCHIGKRISACIIFAAAAAVFLFIAVVTVYKHKQYATQVYDLGIFVQMYHALANHMNAVITCERGAVLSHFKVHASYILWLFVPIYKIFPSEYTLLIIQAFCAMGGAIPMYLIAKKHRFEGLSLIFICFAYIFCAAVIGPCFFDFHENAVLPTLLMWLIWSMEEKKRIPCYVFAALVCIVKEDAPLFVICLGLFFFFHDTDRKIRIHWLALTAVGACYMFLITKWLSETEGGNGQYMMSTRFNHLLISEEGGFSGIIRNVLIDPGYFFSLFLKASSVTFFLQIMLPMLFLPFFTKKLYRFLLMIPFVITNLVISVGYEFAAQIDLQYIFGPAVLLLYLCIVNLDDLSAKNKHDIPILMGTAAILCSTVLYSDRLIAINNYKGDKAYFDALDAMMKDIPMDASVGADTYLLPHVAARDAVYLFDGYAVNMETYRFNYPEAFDIVIIPLDWYTDSWGEKLVEAEEMIQIGGIEGHNLLFCSQSYAESHPEYVAQKTAGLNP